MVLPKRVLKEVARKISISLSASHNLIESCSDPFFANTIIVERLAVGLE